MSKSVVINLGHGDLNKGFPRVTAQLWTLEHPLPEQFIGSLPPAPDLVELYRNWQLIYLNLCSRFTLLSPLEDDNGELEIDESGITNVSIFAFEQLRLKLHNAINRWLKSETFLTLDRQLRDQLSRQEEIRVMIEVNEVSLRRLPWNCWDFFQDYPLAEIALSRPEYKRAQRRPSISENNKVRILAILGNSLGIDLKTEAKLLKNLESGCVTFLVNPNPQEFKKELLNHDGWDILFFGGHSKTEGETGRIYINENKTNNSLTIEELEISLKEAIANGLQLAIFNSCDGLGLGLALEKLSIPTAIVMREPVANLVAQEFFRYFLDYFALQRLPLYLAVQQARKRLEVLEDEFPGASWLPVICQNPAVKPPTWLSLGGIPPCPYRGLFAFHSEDAHLFFGREAFTRQLAQAVNTKKLVTVISPSGSGKSSVVFAGLIPYLRRHCDTPELPLQIGAFRTGNDPFNALAAALISINQKSTNHRLSELSLAIELEKNKGALSYVLEKIVQQGNGQRLLLVADQFEELYTLVPETLRLIFIEELINAVNKVPAFTLVITMRADFLGRALSDEDFGKALQKYPPELLISMNREELESAIAKPALMLGVELEKGLIERIIHDVNQQPGQLPLLQFALTQIWKKQRNSILSCTAYDQIGGVEKALFNHAEQVYLKLSEVDRKRSQQIFIQLVQPGEGTEDTKRLATKAEVGENNWDLVTYLASARVLVTARDENTGIETVEIVHEALIRGWKQIRDWMQQDREFRHWQERLRAAMRQWESSDFDQGGLLLGKPLTDAEYWQKKRSKELTTKERSFIGLSIELREREKKKLKRRRQLNISVLTSALVLSLILAGAAWWQSQVSANSEIKAMSESSKTLFATNQQLEAIAQAISAGKKLKKLIRVETGTQSSVVFALQHLLYRIKEYNRLFVNTRGVQAAYFKPDGSAIATLSRDGTVNLWQPDGKLLDKPWLKNLKEVSAIAFSPNNQAIATASGDTVTIWTLEGRQIRTFSGHKGEVGAVAFSPDGKIIACGSTQEKDQVGTIQLWNANDGTLLTTLDAGKFVIMALAFNSQGDAIASGSWQGFTLWKRDDSWHKILENRNQGVNAVSFSPSSSQILATATGNTVNLWKANATGEYEKTPYTTLSGHTDPVWGVTFSPNGNAIATASDDKSVKLWQPDGTLVKTLLGHKGVVNAVAFSPDGKTLASASQDGTVKLWKIHRPGLLALEHEGSQAYAVAFSPDGTKIVTTSGHGFVTLWQNNGTLLKTEKWQGGPVTAVVFSPNGELIVAASSDRSVQIRKSDGTFVKHLEGHTGELYQSVVTGVSFSPDSQMFVTGADDGSVQLWNNDGKLNKTLQVGGSEVEAVSFSPNGETIASANADGTVKLWTREGNLVKNLTGHRSAVRAVAFSPDGKIIATASVDKTVKLWKQNGRKEFEAKTLSAHNNTVRAIAFSPDGKIFATGSADKTVKLWKTDGTLLKTLSVHEEAVRAIAFSPDGATIASASLDGTVVLSNWQENLDLDRLMVYGCDWMRDYLKNNPNLQSAKHLCNN